MVEQAQGRTILYYPNIRPPEGQWLRQTILYWDQVGSIVPFEVDHGPERDRFFTPDIEYLRGVGVFRPFYPDDPAEYDPVEAFFEEMVELIESSGFRSALDRHGGPDLTPIHRDKFSGQVIVELERRGLAIPSEKGAEWVKVDRRTALFCMSLLAKYLADSEPEPTVPGTDRLEYERMAFGSHSNDELTCAELSLRGLLPVPRDDVSFHDIMTFRQGHRPELLRFREELDAVTRNLRAAESDLEAKEAIQQFRERGEAASRDLAEAMHDSRISTIWGSVKALV